MQATYFSSSFLGAGDGVQTKTHSKMLFAGACHRPFLAYSEMPAHFAFPDEMKLQPQFVLLKDLMALYHSEVEIFKVINPENLHITPTLNGKGPIMSG